MSEDLFTRLARRALGDRADVQPLAGPVPAPLTADADAEPGTVPPMAAPSAAAPTLEVDQRVPAPTTPTTVINPPATPATRPSPADRVELASVTEPITPSPVGAATSPVELTAVPHVHRSGGSEVVRTDVVEQGTAREVQRSEHRVDVRHEVRPAPAATALPAGGPRASDAPAADARPPTIEIHISRLEIGEPAARGRGRRTTGDRSVPATRPAPALGLDEYLARRNRP